MSSSSLDKSHRVTVNIDVELQAVQWIVLLGSGVGELDGLVPEVVEVTKVTKEEILWVPSLVASVTESEVGREEAPS